MYLIRRNSVYQIRYFDEQENRLKQFSTKCKRKQDALIVLSNFQKAIKQKSKPDYISLEGFKKEYLENVKILHSLKYYNSIDATFKALISRTGNIPLIRLDKITLEKFLFETFEKAKHNAWHYYRNLRAAFNYAITKNYLTSNPLLNVKLPKIPDKINLYVSESEFDSILDETKDETLKNLFKFAYNTGMRLGEIVNLKWNSVSFTDKIIKVESDETFRTKNNKSRIIPINETLFSILQNRIPKVIDITKNIYVFNRKGMKFNHDYVSKKFKQAVRDAKLNENYHFHLLRSSFISNLAKRNVPLAAIQKIAGHSSIRITEKHYLAVQDSLLAQAMLSLDNSLKSVSEGF